MAPKKLWTGHSPGCRHKGKLMRRRGARRSLRDGQTRSIGGGIQCKGHLLMRAEGSISGVLAVESLGNLWSSNRKKGKVLATESGAPGDVVIWRRGKNPGKWENHSKGGPRMKRNCEWQRREGSLQTEVLIRSRERSLRNDNHHLPEPI